ncbi:lysozyme inhibitor LprI family protein [Luteimonas galliterrae]|nr:lysozyme inhibitor LprI family protein [Luteimonas galliterrae]
MEKLANSCGFLVLVTNPMDLGRILMDEPTKNEASSLQKSRINFLFHPGLLITALTAGFAIAQTVNAQNAPDLSNTNRMDCFAIGDTRKREECFSHYRSQEIEECERAMPHACKPYKEMHALDLELDQLNARAINSVRSTYHAHTSNDAAYLSDLLDYLNSSDQAWRDYRDAECLLEPFIQGISRREAPNLTEACRAVKTRARIRDLTELFQLLNDTRTILAPPICPSEDFAVFLAAFMADQNMQRTFTSYPFVSIEYQSQDLEADPKIRRLNSYEIEFPLILKKEDLASKGVRLDITEKESGVKEVSTYSVGGGAYSRVYRFEWVNKCWHATSLIDAST